MADPRSAFRFRAPWLPAAPAPRPAIAPRPPAQSTASATPAPVSQRTAETQVPSQPTPSTTPAPTPQTVQPEAPTQPTTPALVSQRTDEIQVPSQPTSTTTPAPTPQTVQPKAPTQPTTTTPTSPITSQTEEGQTPTQSTTTTTLFSTSPQKTKIEAPATSTATANPTPANTRTAQTQPPSQYTATTTPIQEITQTAQAQAPSQPAVISNAATVTTERPPFRPPGVASPQPPLPQPQASRTESQPSSPSRVTSQSRVSSQPASPSRITTQSQSPQPSIPSRAASQSPATSLLSPPSHTEIPNSPTPQTTSQPRSPSHMASRSAGQASSNSPSSTAAHGQPTTATLTQPNSPSKREPRLSPESSQPFSSSTENTSSLLEKEPKYTVSKLQSLEQLQPKEEIKSGIVYDSQKQTPVETSIEPSEMVLQPPKESGMRTTTMFAPTGGSPQTPAPVQKSDTPTRSSQPESFREDSKPEETKEVKEVMQEAKEKTYEEVRDKDDYLLTVVPGSAVQNKEQPSIAFESEDTQQTVYRKQIIETPASNGKKTKAQPRNKTMTVESRPKLAMTNGEHIPLHKEISNDISKLVQKMAAGGPKHSVEDRLASVITLAGENRGATMHLGTDSMKKGGAVPILRGYKINPDESAETTTDGEGSSKVKSEDAKDIEDQAAEAFVNSNVQGINNSIMLDSSTTVRNPGVHLVRSRFPTKLKTSTAERELLEADKTEFSTTHAQKLTYEPMVRRRCLRGLFLESSDSDPDNTAKPRHHGCRVGRKEKSKENKIDVF